MCLLAMPNTNHSCNCWFKISLCHLNSWISPSDQRSTLSCVNQWKDSKLSLKPSSNYWTSVLANLCDWGVLPLNNTISFIAMDCRQSTTLHYHVSIKPIRIRMYLTCWHLDQLEHSESWASDLAQWYIYPWNIFPVAVITQVNSAEMWFCA